MAFSKRHYRAVSPPDDTPEQIRARLADNAVLAQAARERDAAYPMPWTTVEQAKAALDFFERRVRELR